MNAVQNERTEKKLIDVAKKGAETASVFVIAPAIKVIQEKGPKIAEQVAEKAVDIAAEAIKKKKL